MYFNSIWASFTCMIYALCDFIQQFLLESSAQRKSNYALKHRNWKVSVVSLQIMCKFLPFFPHSNTFICEWKRNDEPIKRRRTELHCVYTSLGVLFDYKLLYFNNVFIVPDAIYCISGWTTMGQYLHPRWFRCSRSCCANFSHHFILYIR